MGRGAFLDTQVAMWVAKGDSQLSKSILKEINSHSETVISAISLAELEIKASINKITVPENLAAVFEANGIKVEAFDSVAAIQLARFSTLAMHDPLERMILAQASVRLGTTFFTSDEVMLELDFDWIRSCI